MTNEVYCCVCSKHLIKPNDISLGKGTTDGPKYWCHECSPIPEEDTGEFGMGGDWWKNV